MLSCLDCNVPLSGPVDEEWPLCSKCAELHVKSKETYLKNKKTRANRRLRVVLPLLGIMVATLAVSCFQAI